MSLYHEYQGSATFWTSGQHSVSARFPRAATIPANQKRSSPEILALSSAELMAKTKKKVFAKNSTFSQQSDEEDQIKKSSSPEILAFFRPNWWRRPKNKERIISAVCCCLSIIEKRKKIAGQMTIKGREPGKIPWRAASGARAVGCRPLAYIITHDVISTVKSMQRVTTKSWRLPVYNFDDLKLKHNFNFIYMGALCYSYDVNSSKKFFMLRKNDWRVFAICI